MCVCVCVCVTQPEDLMPKLVLMRRPEQRETSKSQSPPSSLPLIGVVNTLRPLLCRLTSYKYHRQQYYLYNTSQHSNQHRDMRIRFSLKIKSVM